MDFGSFLMYFGMIGCSLLLGVVLRSFSIRETMQGIGMIFAALIFMGGIASALTAQYPLIEPLWLHYLVFVGGPLSIGYFGLAILTRKSTDSDLG